MPEERPQGDRKDSSGLQRVVQGSLAVVCAPYRRWSVGLQQSRLTRQHQSEIREAAAANLKELHDAVWARWSARVENLLRPEEEDE